MSDEPEKDGVHGVLRVLADRLEAYLEGDDLAFDTLGEALDQAHATPDDLQSAALVLRSLVEAPAGGEAAIESLAPSGARVLSSEERGSLSPEAWGALLDLRRRGSLDPAQFEQVLELLASLGVRPVDRDLALEVATRVALQGGLDEDTEMSHGDHDVAH